MKPIVLLANQPRDRFYAGGARIAAFRGTGMAEPHTPEDWAASVTTVRGQAPAGLTTLPDGIRLADAVAADPTGWLGAEHVAAFGADPRLLVKLLDAGQRLPVHAHPDDAFAAARLGAVHGKAEAWYILTPGDVHLGLAEPIAREELDRIVDEQDVATLLARMHRLPVRRGDTVFVPPGVLHAIGEGILLVEVQQPEDLSILLEWEGFAVDGRRDGHLDLGFASALDAVETTARSADAVAHLVRRAPGAGPVLPEEADAFFRLDLLEAEDRHEVVPAGYGVLIVLQGELAVHVRGAETTAAPVGTTLLIPAAAGSPTIAGRGTALLARPPAPTRAQ